MKTVMCPRWLILACLVTLLTRSGRAQEGAGSVPSEISGILRPTAGDLGPFQPLRPFSTPLFRDLTSSWGPPGAGSATPRQQAQRLVEEAGEHQAAGRWRAALTATGQAIAADPSYAMPYSLRANLYEEKQLNAHAIATMTDALAAHPDSATFWGKRGRLRCFQRDFAGGLADIEHGIGLAPGPSPLRTWLDRTRAFAYGELGEDRRCVAEYDVLIAAAGKAVMTDYYYRGLAFLRLREWDHAVADFERAAELVPDDQQIYHRGYARLRAGRFSAALADYERSRVAYPDSPDVQVEYALALFAVGRRDEAIEDLNHWLDRNPTDPAILTARGWAGLMTGDYSRAHVQLNQAAEHELSRLSLGGGIGWLLKEPRLDSIMTDFEARCRTYPNLPFAVYYRTGAEARTSIMPYPEFNLGLAFRFPRDSGVAPMLILQASVDIPDQPWRLAAHIGEILAAACLLDRAKIGTGVENLYCGWLNPTSIPWPDQIGLD